MEGLLSSTSLNSGLKGYWRRSRRRGAYQRLNGSSVEYKRRRFWKINLKPRLKLNLNLNLKLWRFSPKKLLLNMRNAYVNMMLKIASSRCMNSGLDGFGIRKLKDYDEKVLVEIYKSVIMAQGQLVPRDAAAAAKFGTEHK